MYHWYLLIRRSWACGIRSGQRASHFIDGGGPDWGDCSRPSGEGWRMAGLGAVEAVPFFACSFGGPELAPHIPTLVWLLAGVALMVLACWCLRHHTPHSPIHAVVTPAARMDSDGAK